MMFRQPEDEAGAPRVQAPGAAALACAWLTLLAAVAEARPTAEKQAEYTLGVDPELRTLTGTVCVEGPRPRALVTFLAEARPLLVRAWVPDDEARRPVRPVGGEVPWPAGARCLGYAVSLEGALAAADPDLARASGRDRSFAPDLWLWTPGPKPPTSEVLVTLTLPPGLHLAAPWARVDASRYAVPPSTFRLPAVVALVHAPPHELALEHQTLVWSVLEGPRRVDDGTLGEWLAASARAVEGTWSPRIGPRVLVLAFPHTRPGAEEPVFFGQASRGGGPTVELELDADADLPRLLGDWILVHELSHFAHPAFAREAAVLGEGLATYFQNTLRVGAGLLDEREGWQNFVDGLERGRRDAERLDLSLEAASRDMLTLHAYHRVYWSGAALAFRVDLRLHREGRSLEGELRGLVDHAKDPGERLTVATFAERFDKAIAGKIFRQELNQAMGLKAIPPLGPDLAKLGVRVVDGRVELDDRAPLAPLRRRMMGLDTQSLIK